MTFASVLLSRYAKHIPGLVEIGITNGELSVHQSLMELESAFNRSSCDPKVH